MKITFSAILNTLQNSDIFYTEGRCLDRVSYLGANILSLDQTVYHSGFLYIGDYKDYQPQLVHSQCGFLISNTPDKMEPPETSEWAILHHGGNEKQLIGILQAMFAYSLSQMESAEVLISSLMKGRGLKYLLDICCDILQNPVLMATPDAQLLMISSERYEIKDPAVLDLVQNGYSSPEFIQAFHRESIQERLQNENKPFLVDSGFSTHTRRILYNVTVSGKSEAILLALESNRVFSARDYNIIHVLGTAIANEIKIKNTPQGALYEYQLLNMIKGVPVDTQHQMKWLESQNWKTYSNFTICVIHSSEDIRMMQAERELRTYIRFQPACRIVCTEQEIILITNFYFKTQEEEFYSYVQQKLVEWNLYGGISQTFHTLDALSFQHRLAQDACTIGEIMVPENRLAFYQEISAYCLLHQAAQAGSLTQFLSPSLDILSTYDHAYGTDYYYTLFVFLQTGSKVKTAEKLYIHRNTLNYRLTKISELIPDDIENGEDMYRLLLSFYTKEYLGKLETSHNTSI